MIKLCKDCIYCKEQYDEIFCVLGKWSMDDEYLYNKEDLSILIPEDFDCIDFEYAGDEDSWLDNIDD